MSVRKLILFGAYDRYNYGDNLMPIVLADYLREKFSADFSAIEIIYASIKDSDLSQFGCQPTVSIRTILKTLACENALIVTGGEVLCARNDTLYLHTIDNPYQHAVLTWLQKKSRKTLRWVANKFYSTPWEFPYIPDPAATDPNIKIRIAYNSVGGGMTRDLSSRERETILSRLSQAAHFSVRDERTLNSFALMPNAKLVPDSVILLSSLYPLATIAKKIRSSLVDALKGNYVVVQAAPSKAKGQAAEVAKQIELIHSRHGVRTVLLPIGYASGHDDALFLQQVQNLKPNITTTTYDLTIWEILYVIAKSRAYYGTSLHGAITAMSYNVPHFGLNPKITKLDAYLKTWSVEPFNRCIAFEEMAEHFAENYEGALQELKFKTLLAQEKTEENIGAMMSKLFPDHFSARSTVTQRDGPLAPYPQT